MACRSDSSSRGLGAVVPTTSCPLEAAGVEARQGPARHSTRRRFAVQGVQALSDGPKSEVFSTDWRLTAVWSQMRAGQRPGVRVAT